MRESQIRRIMRIIRERSSLDRMIDRYIDAYERINGDAPLAQAGQPAAYIVSMSSFVTPFLTKPSCLAIA